MATPQDLQDGDALIVVDVQEDFLPAGQLPVPEGDAIIPTINRWIDAAVEKETPLYFSRDMHPPDHCSFKEQGGPWPVHCVREQPGSDFADELNVHERGVILDKGTRPGKDAYSAFDETGLLDELRRQGVQRVWIVGLAQDVCVRATAIDAKREGWDVRVIMDATRPATEEGGKEAVADMEQAGIVLENRDAVGAVD